MMRVMVAMLCMWLSGNVMAWTVKLKWDIPTFREDCSPLKVEEIAKYELEWVNKVTNKRGVKFTSKGTLTGYSLYVPDVGRYGFRIRTYDVNGLYGEWHPQIEADVKGDGTVVALPTAPYVNKCVQIPPPLPLCPATCRCNCPT